MTAITVQVPVPQRTVDVAATTIPYTVAIADDISNAEAAGYTVTGPSSGTPPPTGLTLLAYIKTLGANKAGVLTGQTLDLYSKTPLDALDTTPGVSFPNVTVHLPGPATGLCPAIIDLFSDPNGPAGDIEPSNPAPNNTVSLANAAIAAGCIIRLNSNPPNPSGANNNPWPAVLTAGSAVQKAFLASLATDAAMFKQINGPFILDFMGEMNLEGGLNAGNNWASAGVAGCTSANFAALWVLMWNYFTVTEGLANKILFSYETNDSVGQYTFGMPDLKYVDLVGVHIWSPFANSDAYNAMVATGLPVGFGSCGLTYLSVANFTQNNFSAVCEAITSKFPLVYGIALWNMGGNAYSQQNGAVQCLSAAPWLNRSNVPKITSAR